jgi:2-methylfumaryl-CoA hydratase
MDAGAVGNFFEDFSVGQKLRHRGGRTVTTGDNALYIALTGDRCSTYCDAAFARGLGYECELINDLLVFHIVFGKTVSEISLNAVANLGYADVRFCAPVYPGDTLRAETTIAGLKENSSGKTGTVYVHTQGFNQREEVVLEFYRWVMVNKRDTGTACAVNEVPDLPTVVEPSLSMPTPGEVEWVEGRFWEDYAENEWLYDGAGMTLEEPEHALATRLYQNTAKVHFDARLMAETAHGKRLVYGGHVISLAHALVYPLFPNLARIAVWNGGTHSNPVFAGDTLYAAARVLEREEMDGRSDYGYVRVQLVCLKDRVPDAESLVLKQRDSDSGREKYCGHVVLDLDYWLIVARKGQA